MKKFLLIFLALLPCLSLQAWDAGIILDTNPVVSGIKDADVNFDFSGILIPRFSASAGSKGKIFISMGAKTAYQSKQWSIVPEVLRTDISFRFGDSELGAGRMLYADPLGFIAEGLFDGVQYALNTQAGSISLGAWYTGLLYKKRAVITMTPDELQSWETARGASAYTYFAPRRLVSALNWEHPALGEIVRAKIAVLCQFDLGDTNLHSQYLAAKFAIPAGAFVFDLGGCLEFIQDPGLIQNKNKFSVALAGEAGINWNTPARFEDRLSLSGRFSSGVADKGAVSAFLPLTTQFQGDVLQAKLSGLSILSLSYIARLHRTISVNAASSYFIRSDLGTYTGYVNSLTGYFLGNEFFGRCIWSPVSDIQINLGGGAFLPSLGNVDPHAGVQWRVELSLILALL